MASSRSVRVGLVTVGLALAGFVCGTLALGGGDALALLLRPDGTGIAAALLPFIALLGGVLGAALVPVVAWTTLRRAPLWQVVLVPALGAGVGHALEWILVGQTTFAAAAAGLLLAALALAAWHVRTPRGVRTEAGSAPGEHADRADAPARLAAADDMASPARSDAAARLRVRR